MTIILMVWATPYNFFTSLVRTMVFAESNGRKVWNWSDYDTTDVTVGGDRGMR